MTSSLSVSLAFRERSLKTRVMKLGFTFQLLRQEIDDEEDEDEEQEEEEHSKNILNFVSEEVKKQEKK